MSVLLTLGSTGFQGYATALCEEGNIVSTVLLKYFGKELKEDWIQEVNVVKGLPCGEDPHANILHYRWHSKGKKLIYGLINTFNGNVSHTFCPKCR